MMTEELKAVLRSIPQQHQRQDSTNRQLLDLRQFANKLGMYDAADFIQTVLDRAVLKNIDRIERGNHE